MKTVTVQLSQDEMRRIIEQLEPGDSLELTDGERRLVFQGGNSDGTLESGEGRPELAAGFLLGNKERLDSYSPKEMEALAEEMRRKKEPGGNG